MRKNQSSMATAVTLLTALRMFTTGEYLQSVHILREAAELLSVKPFSNLTTELKISEEKIRIQLTEVKVPS